MQGNVWLINAGFVNVAAQIGPDGVLVVDTGTEAMGEKILAEIKRLAGDKPIRYIVNTHAHPDHVGGNVIVAKAGRSVIAGNFAPQAGAAAANAAKIFAHENTQLRMNEGEGNQPAAPAAALPTDTFFTVRNDLYFNGEAVQMLHQPHAHTDGDIIVYFRKSDVIVAGDVYVNTTFPVINLQQGGSYDGLVAALNRIVEITVPKDKQEGGTYVIPGHGRLADEADVVEYRDMVTIVRDRIRDAIKKGLTLAQVKADGLRSRLRGAVRRDAGLLDDGRIPRGGVQEPHDTVGSDARGGANECQGRACTVSATDCGERLYCGVMARVGLRAARRRCRAGGGAADTAGVGADRSDRVLGVDRQRGLAMADGHAAEGRLRQRADQSRGPQGRRHVGRRRRTDRAWRSAPPVSCGCRRGSTSPGRTRTR